MAMADGERSTVDFETGAGNARIWEPAGRRMRVLREDPVAGVATAVAIAAAFGAVVAWLTPRGPVTSAEALATMAAALAVGLAAGGLSCRRSAILLAPVVFTVAFEIARAGTVGPTVDAIDLSGLLGILAFVLGRVFPAILTLLPLAIGGVWGVWLADRSRRQTRRRIGPVAAALAGIGTIGLALLGAMIAVPASTAPIPGPDGEPLPGSIAELATVRIGGHDQTMMIRGRSLDHPVLLYLAGGPGGTDLGAVRRDVSLEQDFVVVAWDQRGAGKSYAALDPTDTFTVDGLVADAIEVANYLRDRFDEERIYLVGQSWGSTLGVLAAQQAPDLFHAFVGVGQMVSQRETDILFWEDTLAWARSNGDERLAARLIENGPPPYADLHMYDPIVSHEHDWNSYPEFDSTNEMPAILFVPEYTFMDRVNAFRGFLDTNGTLYPQLQEIDFRTDVPELEVPFTMVLGNREARGRTVLANEWFAMLNAPTKESVVFEGAGHRAHFDRPGEFAELMRGVRDRGEAR